MEKEHRQGSDPFRNNDKTLSEENFPLDSEAEGAMPLQPAQPEGTLPQPDKENGADQSRSGGGFEVDMSDISEAMSGVAESQDKEKAPDKEEEESRTDMFQRGDTEQTDTIQYLSFRLDREIFAFEVDKIREVLTFDTVTKVPQTPDFMRGVINLRGSVVSVVDLRLLFGMSETQKTIDTCVIIVEVDMEGEKTAIGALADSVVEVFEIAEGALEPAPRIGTYLKTDYLKGMAKRADGSFVLVLDSERIFSAEEFLEKIAHWSR